MNGYAWSVYNMATRKVHPTPIANYNVLFEFRDHSERTWQTTQLKAIFQEVIYEKNHLCAGFRSKDQLSYKVYKMCLSN